MCSTAAYPCRWGRIHHRDERPPRLNPRPCEQSLHQPLCLYGTSSVPRGVPSQQLTDCSSGWARFTVCCMWSPAVPRVRQMTSSPGKCVRVAAHETLFLLHLPSSLPAMRLLRSTSQVGSAVNPRPNDATPHSSSQDPGCFRLDSRRKIKEPTPSNPPCPLAKPSRSTHRLASHHQRSPRDQYDPSAATALKRRENALHRTTSEGEIPCSICHIRLVIRAFMARLRVDRRPSLAGRASTVAADLGALRPTA